MADDRDILSQVLAILVLDDHGERLAVKYYSGASKFPRLENDTLCQALEKQVVAKAASQGLRKSQQVEILTHLDFTMLYRSAEELQIVVIGHPSESLILLSDVLNATFQCLGILTNEQFTRACAMDKLDAVFMVLDEIVADGEVFEVDPAVICARLESAFPHLGGDSGAASGTVEARAAAASSTRLASTFNQAFAQARDTLIRSLLTGA